MFRVLFMCHSVICMILLPMPHKYILVSQLYARTPFQQCQLRFIIKPRSFDAPVNTARPFTLKPVAVSPGQYLHFEYEVEHVDALAMHVVAISNNQVVNLGFVPLHLDQEVWEKKQYLKGIVEQNGYVIMSTRNNPFQGDNSRHKENISLNKHDEIEAARYDRTKKQRKQNSIQQDSYQLQSPINQLRSFQQYDSRITQNASVMNKLSSVKRQPQHMNTPTVDQNMDKEHQVQSFTPQSQKTLKQDHQLLQSPQIEQIYTQTKKFLVSHKNKNIEHQENLLQKQKVYEEQQKKLRLLGLHL